jgi:hypothetical protein
LRLPPTKRRLFVGAIVNDPGPTKKSLTRVSEVGLRLTAPDVPRLIKLTFVMIQVLFPLRAVPDEDKKLTLLDPGICTVKPVPKTTVALVKVTSERKRIVVDPVVVKGVAEVKVAALRKVIVPMLTKLTVFAKVALLVKLKLVVAAAVMLVREPVKLKRGLNCAPPLRRIEVPV